MTHLTEKRLWELLGNFRGKRIAVVGDLMLDRYYWGSVHRVSPEAPVPVVEVDTESIRFGGRQTSQTTSRRSAARRSSSAWSGTTIPVRRSRRCSPTRGSKRAASSSMNPAPRP